LDYLLSEKWEGDVKHRVVSVSQPQRLSLRRAGYTTNAAVLGRGRNDAAGIAVSDTLIMPYAVATDRHRGPTARIMKTA